MAASNPQGEDETISGINVTPLVDVTFVLLVVFMVTAKLIVSQTLPMDLPRAATSGEQQIVFAVDLGAGGEVAVDGKPIGRDEDSLPLAREAAAKSREVRAVIRADARVPHGRVVRVMDLLKQAGLSKVAFGVTPGPREGEEGPR